MTKQGPKVSVVIVNWNGQENTLECLNYLSKSSMGRVQGQIIVIDNASTDGSVEAIKKLDIKDFDLRLIRNSRNLGFAQGNNIGLRAALVWGAEYVLLVNNDLYVAPDLIEKLLQVADEYPRGGAFSPKIYFASGFEFHKARYKKSQRGRVIWYAGGDIDWDNVLGSNHGVDDVDEGQYDKASETDFATGACTLLRASALAEVGIFNEKYFMYIEDGDLCVRLKKKGWGVFYTPKAHAWHKVAQSSGIGSELNDYFITRNRLLFGMKYAPLRAKIALLRESSRLLVTGRKWQKIGVNDFYLLCFGKGSWK
jgi:GT2 family glycosyltransferase